MNSKHRYHQKFRVIEFDGIPSIVGPTSSYLECRQPKACVEVTCEFINGVYELGMKRGRTLALRERPKPAAKKKAKKKGNHK
jgi:hypothetical protein